MIKLFKSKHIYLAALFVIAIPFFTCSQSNEEETTAEVEIDTVFTLAAGDYKGLWNSKASGGAVYSNLNLTARIEEGENGVFTGFLYISDDFTSCCGSVGEGDGAITVTISGHDVTFDWIDEIPNCKGTFRGIGTLSANNAFTVVITGTDCDGDHTGSIQLFK